MSNVKTFLKVLSKVGYPNPDIQSIARMIDYNIEEFLPDLVAEIGEEKADDFTEKALNKMSTKDGIRIQDEDDPEQYAYIKLHNPRLDLDNDETTVLCDWSWGDTNIFFKDDDGNETYKTIQEIGEDIGMGDWADYDEMVDDIKEDCNKLVFNSCGFGIWWPFACGVAFEFGSALSLCSVSVQPDGVITTENRWPFFFNSPGAGSKPKLNVVAPANLKSS